MKILEILERYVGDISYPPIGVLTNITLKVSIEDMIKIQEEIKDNYLENFDIETNTIKKGTVNIKLELKK